MKGEIKYSTTGKIATVEFFHPQSNSMPGDLLVALAKQIRLAGADESVAVIQLKSSGEKTFCAGASFDELVAIGDRDAGEKFFSGFAYVINAIRSVPKFVVARIQGKCVGGGVGIAAAADYAIAHESAAVKLSELAVGIGPFVVGPAVERKIGTAAFAELAIDATGWRSAAWALQKGLFAEVHATQEETETAVQKLLNTLSGSSPEAMAEMKKIFWRGTEQWNDLLLQRAEISGRLVLSEFTKEAIARFKAKQ